VNFSLTLCPIAGRLLAAATENWYNFRISAGNHDTIACSDVNLFYKLTGGSKQPPYGIVR